MPRFPLDRKVLPFDATSGMRQFGARRDKDKSPPRLHAAADLYAPHGTPIRAIADGTFIARKRFYMSTEAVVVHHPGIGVVRYGEVMEATDYTSEKRALARIHGKDAPTSVPHFEVRADVKEGDVIAHVGDLDKDSNFMLHFELYEEDAAEDDLWAYKGVGRYGRHPLLLDPTPLLEALQRDGSLAPGLKPDGKMKFPLPPVPRKKPGSRASLGPVSFPDRRSLPNDGAFARLVNGDANEQNPSSSWDEAATLYRSTWRT